MNRQFVDRIQPLARHSRLALLCALWTLPPAAAENAPTGASPTQDRQSATQAAGSSLITLTDIADTFTHKARPSVNHGGKAYMRAHGPDERKLSFIRFDVSGLSGTVTSAILKLYVNDVPDAGMVEVHAVQAGWNEFGVTHNDKPQYDATPTASLALSAADEGQFVSLDITGLVQQWAVSPATAFGIALTSPNLHARFDTRETAHAPVVEAMVDGTGNASPSVVISEPVDNSQFGQGDSVSFAGTASDPEEGNLTGLLEWRSDRDGILASGGSFSSTTLSVGTHTITATVRDSAGAVGSDNIRLVVASDSASRDIRFQDVSNALGNLPDTRTYGISWADYDDDGWVDVFLNNHFNTPYMLRNNSGTAFVDVTEAVGMADRADHHSCHWADYDNDVDDDLYCTTGAKRGTGSVPANFWRNNNNSDFTDIAAATNTENGRGRGRSLGWLDFDHDGDLDLFVGTVVKDLDDPVSVLYRNDGNQFTNVAAQAGVDLPGIVELSTVFDYDGDDDWDLLWNYRAFDDADSPCSPSCILVMRNNGAGRFIPLAGSQSGISTTAKQMITVGDYDNDNDIDVFAGASASSSKRLYLNRGNGTFAEVSVAAAGLSPILDMPLQQGISADFDNDGFLDLFFVLDDEDSNHENMIFFGEGNGTFVNGSSGANVGGTNRGSGDVAATADFNNDGFLDLLIGYGAGEAAGPYELLRNEGNANHWLRVRLEASGDSTALGSKIWIVSGGRMQYREYADQTDGHAFHELVAHFGLGASTVVESLRVQWPDGTISERSNIGADQLLTLFRDQSGGNQAPVVVIKSPDNNSDFLPGNL